MRVVIQRVNTCSVTINSVVNSQISNGLLVLAGFENEDNEEDLLWMSKKIAGLRIFNDSEGIMNLDINEVKGEILIVSQFTLHAKTKKGNRPSYIKAAKPEIAIPLYETFVAMMNNDIQSTVKTGEFGAEMKIELVNDGPVTIIMDSKHKE
jgi:D-tyrosyl-tRNA(Tyr) deacylase